jgi:hypothetical protein
VAHIADKVILDDEVALVDVDHKGKLIHIVQDRPLAIVHDLAAAPVADAVDLLERAALGDLLDGEIELGAGDEVDRL